MQYISHYDSPLGPVLLAADEIGLIGLWFEGQKYYGQQLDLKRGESIEKELPVFDMAKRWLDIYFSGREPEVAVPCHQVGTSFQQEVWQILCEIPYGQTVTYGQIADRIAHRRGQKRMSAQAVGGAVGRNPIALIVPCHRVVGSDGSMTGYAGGIDKKRMLLQWEREKKILLNETETRNAIL